MPSFNFLKEAKVYLVYSGNQYLVDVSAISFSQTFTENSYSVKTLHNQKNVFDGSVINKANPANFEFTFPAIKDSDFVTVFNLLVDYETGTNKMNTFDLYISTELDVFKIETCVITNGSFVIEKSRPLSLTVSGEASKLSYFGAKSDVTIPGSVQSRSATMRYNMNPAVSVTLDTYALSNIVNVAVELQNDIEWNPYTTVHQALQVTSATNAMYPTDFVLKNRVLSGSIQRYVTETKGTIGASDNVLALQSWDTSAPITITAGEGSGGSFRGFSFNGNCSFTNRLGTGSVFLQSHDWRLTDNPTNLSSIISYTTGA
jgi:hypothetical protein